MVRRVNLIAVILASIVHPAINRSGTRDHGSKAHNHLSNTSTEFAEVIEAIDSPEIKPVDHSSGISIWRSNNETFGCPSDAKVCVPLCCPPGIVSLGVRCVNSENSSDLPTPMIKHTDVHVAREEDISDVEFYPVWHDPCAISWMRSAIVKDFEMFKNGSISAPQYNGGPVVDFGGYCLLLQDSKSERMYFARMCRPWVQRGYYEIFCLISSAIILMAILIVYTIIPELRNLHGHMFRCYVASCICLYTCTIGLQYTTELKERAGWFIVADITGRYCGGSCLMWLNVISFNIWRSFRCLRPIHSSERQKKVNRAKFIRYAICVWFSLIFLFGVAALIICYVPFFQDDIVADALRQWGCVALVTVSFPCNMYFYVSTSLTIKHQTAHISDVIDSVNRHQEADGQWLSLYWKLLPFLGVHAIIWIIWLSWTTRLTMCLVATVEVVQSGFTFVVFVWIKDDVRRALYKMFF